MQDQWDNPEFARYWDQAALIRNPIRAEQIEILVSLIADLYQKGTHILDLGIGSGQIEELLFARRPESVVVGIDASRAMLDLAQERLTSYKAQCTLIQHDLATLQECTLPTATYQLAFSVQTLHHLTYEEQQAVFRFVAQTLAPGGIFLLIDRVEIKPEPFGALYLSMWNHLTASQDTENAFFEELRQKEDHPMPLEQLLKGLQEAGFQTSCLHLYLHRAFVAGIKPAQ
ncbi:methyltransferase family protein [Thermosporothrix hazakensis]|uniref:Methyltransferase family protein n=2 Tax=Thermosporothrix TaxID=768650 RepID=A0A326U9H6_THEHA|nr:class I SAM-dependent methyltransferase [Thermosporothrix hazakensis]PZW31063.1 methyltransferase family protein [Thermosporothrix hazakensis]BBH86719.1 hypothetical protein KTC_14700 [Thermosporothrix sp. COM3]GCE51022.1 hypothetical protein KTH_58910 [Thermosporothrix hazakensis]